jgi:hypothetical protein
MKIHRPFDALDVKAVFDAYPRDVRADLLDLRELIFRTGSKTEGVGTLVETLKWGQPAYLPSRPKIGTTVRIDALGDRKSRYAMFVHCQTTLISSFRTLYPHVFVFEGSRAVLFTHGEELPHEALKHCIAMALTYHLKSQRI